jgi:site-specific recombinase XerD
MPKHNARNVRITRQYLAYLKEAMRQSDPSVDASAESLARFEADTGFKDFATFRVEQAVAFKRHLAEKTAPRTGKPLSTATVCSILMHLRRFFRWLAVQPGYRRVRSTDAEYFNPSDKEARIASARRTSPYPTLEQIKTAIAGMRARTETERRDRAVVALILLTDARDSAVVSLRLKHLDIAAGRLDQDAREVRMKNSKTFSTFFFPAGPEIRQVVEDWVKERRAAGATDDPLFPTTAVTLCADSGQFKPIALGREPWKTSAPVRQIFRRAFEAAGLPYFNPHSIRKTLVELGEKLCQTPEEFKAWSQNLGHEEVLTTFTSYGAVQISGGPSLFGRQDSATRTYLPARRRKSPKHSNCSNRSSADSYSSQ